MQTRSQATKAKARASKQAAKPSTHVYPHPRKPERVQELKLAAITKPGSYMMETLIRKAKLPTQRQFGVPFLAAPCPVDGSHTDGDALALQIGPDKLFCRAGDHAIGIEEFIGIIAQGSADEFARYVDLLHPSDPEMPRFYALETQHAQAVSEDPEMALEMLRAKRDEPVRGIAIEADSIQIAKQLLGQPASRKKMRFCESIPRTDSGRLAHMAWHRGPMTERERLIDTRLRESAEAEQRGERLKRFQRLKMELAL